MCLRPKVINFASLFPINCFYLIPYFKCQVILCICTLWFYPLFLKWLQENLNIIYIYIYIRQLIQTTTTTKSQNNNKITMLCFTYMSFSTSLINPIGIISLVSVAKHFKLCRWYTKLFFLYITTIMLIFFI